MRLKRGFTLLELLVAMAILSLLVVMLFGMVDTTARLWRQNENGVDAYREARAALNVITDELRAIVTSTNQNYFATNFVGSYPSDASTNGPLFFLTSLPTSAQPSGSMSDVCAVGYYIRWTKQNVGFANISANDISAPGFQLFRAFYPGGLTYTNIVGNVAPLRDIAQPTAAGSTQPEILARNISSIEFLCFQPNGAGTGLTRWTYSPSNPVPSMIEVRITAISDNLAKMLNGDKTLWSSNNPNFASGMRTFVSRVKIQQPANN